MSKRAVVEKVATTVSPRGMRAGQGLTSEARRVKSVEGLREGKEGGPPPPPKKKTILQRLFPSTFDRPKAPLPAYVLSPQETPE